MQVQEQKGTQPITEEKNKSSENREIIKWVSTHLQKPNHLLYSKGRTLIINLFDEEVGIKNQKEVTIPKPKVVGVAAWEDAWMEVYNYCVSSVKAEFNFYVKKEFIIRSGENEYIVGGKIFTLPSDVTSVEYIRIIEEMINTYDELIKKQELQNNQKEKDEIVVSQSTVSIIKPSALIGDSETNTVKAQRVPLPMTEVQDNINEASKAVVQASLDQREETVAYGSVLNCEKISDGETISIQEAREFKENNVPFVLVTCTDITKGKERDIFMENADLLAELNIPLGAFIGGKAITSEQGDHELKVMLTKLLNQHDFIGPIVYEVNNEAIIENSESPEAILEVLNTANGICDVLQAEGYAPVKCMDLETVKIASRTKQNMPEYEENYEVVSRVVPRQKNELNPNDSYLLTDPMRINDVISIYNFTQKKEKVRQAA